MTLEQEAVKAIHNMSAESLKSLVDYANFLISRSMSMENAISNSVTGIAEIPKKPYRSIIGRSKGKVRLADDFNEIPDGFKEYI